MERQFLGNICLDQSSVLAVVNIFPNTLYPVISQCAWGSLGAWGALASFIARLAFDSSWTPLTRGPFRPQCPLSSLGARRLFASWFSYVTFVSTWSYGSLRTGRTRNACWPRVSRVSRHTWNFWHAKAGAITTRPICWKLLSALHVQRKQRFYFILMIDMST